MNRSLLFKSWSLEVVCPAQSEIHEVWYTLFLLISCCFAVWLHSWVLASSILHAGLHISAMLWPCSLIRGSFFCQFRRLWAFGVHVYSNTFLLNLSTYLGTHSHYHYVPFFPFKPMLCPTYLIKFPQCIDTSCRLVMGLSFFHLSSVIVKVTNRCRVRYIFVWADHKCRYVVSWTENIAKDHLWLAARMVSIVHHFAAQFFGIHGCIRVIGIFLSIWFVTALLTFSTLFC